MLSKTNDRIAVLAPEVKHGIIRIENMRSKNCPDLDNQESFAEGYEAFDKKSS